MRALLVSFALLFVACAETDEDRLDAFVKAVTGEVTEARIEHVLRTYVSIPEESIDVRAFGDSRIYREDEEARFETEARARLSRLEGRTLNSIRRRIDIEGATARVELQFLGRDAAGTVRYTLHKHGTRWLIGSVSVGQ